MNIQYKKMVFSALLVAVSVAMGYLFFYIPNVEMITATVFISGVFAGPLYGLLIGMVAEAFFSMFNPYGIPIPTMLLAQIVAFGIIGFSGGCFKTALLGSRLKYFLLGAAGLSLTLLYDVLTTLSFALTMSEVSFDKVLAVFASGFLFYAIHVGVNTLIFVVVVPVLLTRLYPFLPEYIKS